MTPVSLLSSLWIGLGDSAGPAAITNSIIFTFFLYGIMTWQGERRAVFLGGGFIAGVAVTTPLINLGFFDNRLDTSSFDIISQWVHFILELACLAAALVGVRDWRVYKKTPDLRQLILRYLFLESAKREFPVKKGWGRSFLWLLLAYLCGAFAAMLVSVWPGDQKYFSVLQYRIFSPGLHLQTIFSALIYGAAFSAPLILELAGFKFASGLSTKRNLLPALPRVQVFMAAVFLAYGAAMLYVYYIRFYFINH